MKQAYTYTDDKTNKFWWIDYSDTSLAVNYGKTGTNGRFKLSLFDTEEDCVNKAKKLIAQKLKKGYQLDDSYDFSAQYYFDDREEGKHIKTSHPNFAKYFSDEFYLDGGDEEAPFGSDEGFDAFAELEQNIRKTPTLDLTNFPKILIEECWGMTFIAPPQACQLEALKDLVDGADNMEGDVYQSDKVIIATAFGQIKITGRVDKALKEQALLSLQRLDMLAKYRQWGMGSQVSSQIFNDLSAFNVY